MQPPSDRDREARSALDRAARDSETLGGSTLARTTKPGGDDGSGVGPGFEDGEHDPVEIWGRRVGRVISVVLAIVLTWWLGVQLGWWAWP